MSIRRSALVLSTAFTVACGAVAIVPATAKPAKLPKAVTLAPGAVVRYQHVRVSSTRTVRTAVLRLDLRNPRIRLGAASPANAIGAPRQTITALTRQNRGVGGINADFFKNGHPLGGLVVDGALLKSPRRDWDANFYLRGGRAHIGAVRFTGTVERAERPAPRPEPEPESSGGSISLPPLFPGPEPEPAPKPTPATSRTLTSVNTLRDLTGDRLVLVTSALATPKFGRACTAVLASPSGRGLVVTAVRTGVTSIPRRTGGDVAVVACGTDARATWLRNAFVVGDRLRVTTALAGGVPTSLVSGGQVLVRNGRGFDDRDGKTISGRNPETFGCVSRDGTKVVLGTIDGRREGSSGVTIPELRRYLLRLRCWSGIVFDGGGSSTLVGRPTGKTKVRVLNRPSDRKGARAVTTGLLLYRR